MSSSLKSLLRELVLEHMASRQGMKLPFDQMSPLLTDLEQRLSRGEMSEMEFNAEYSDILRAAGWSSSEFENEIDRRWDFVDHLRNIPAKPRVQN